MKRVLLTQPQIDALIDAATYWETELEDQVERGEATERDIAVLNRAIDALAGASR